MRLVNFLPAFHPKPMLISVGDGSFVSNKLLDLPFNPVCQIVPFDGGIKSVTIKY
jgi:hypothetical protein